MGQTNAERQARYRLRQGYTKDEFTSLQQTIEVTLQTGRKKAAVILNLLTLSAYNDPWLFAKELRRQIELELDPPESE